MSTNEISKWFRESIQVKQALVNDLQTLERISLVADRCVESLQAGGKIIFCGNGGSFADAQHLSAEFTSRFLFDRPSLPSVALGTNASAMSAIGNDYGFDEVFSRELESIGQTSDVFIAITTSGKSRNVLEAISVAKKKSIFTAVFTGSKLGKIPSDVLVIHAPSTDTARIQESHILIGHSICALAEQSIYGRAQQDG